MGDLTIDCDSQFCNKNATHIINCLHMLCFECSELKSCPICFEIIYNKTELTPSMIEEVQENFIKSINHIQELIKVVEKVKRGALKHQKTLENILPKIILTDSTIKDEIQLMNSMQFEIDNIVKVSKNALYNNYKNKFQEIIELLTSFRDKKKTFKYFIPSKSITARTLTGELVPINIKPTPCPHYHEIDYKPVLYKLKLSRDMSIFELHDGGFMIRINDTLNIFSKYVCTSIDLDLYDFVYGNGFIVLIGHSELICYSNYKKTKRGYYKFEKTDILEDIEFDIEHIYHKGVAARGDSLYVIYNLRSSKTPFCDPRFFIFCWSFETKSVVWNTEICERPIHDRPYIYKYEDFLLVRIYKEDAHTSIHQKDYFINYDGKLIPETERPPYEINSFGYSTGTIFKEHSFMDIQADFALDGVAVFRLPNGADDAIMLADGTVIFNKKNILYSSKDISDLIKKELILISD